MLAAIGGYAGKASLRLTRILTILIGHEQFHRQHTTWARHIAKLPSQTPKNSHPVPAMPKDACRTTPEGHTAPPANKTTVTELAHLRVEISKLAEKLAQQSVLRSLVNKFAERRSTLGVLKGASHEAQSTPITSTTTPIPLIQHEPAPQVKPRKLPRALKTRTSPVNPLHRNSPRRLVIDHPIPRSSQRSGQMLVDAISSALEKATQDSNTRVVCMIYSKNGRPVAIAAESTTAEALIPHRTAILKAITGTWEPVTAWVDNQQFRVKLNGVPTKGPDKEPLSLANILNQIANTWEPAKKALLAQPPSWISPANKLDQKTHSSIVIPFASQQDAIDFLQYRGFQVFGERCRASIFSEHPPRRQPSIKHIPHADPEHHTSPARNAEPAPSTGPTQPLHIGKKCVAPQLESQTSDMQA